MNNVTKVLLAIGIGAALGILYAPEEGAETRKKILRRSKKLAGSVNDGIEGGKESLEEIKDVLQKQISRVNRKLEEIKF
jgi:gas vesicle protein